MNLGVFVISFLSEDTDITFKRKCIDMTIAKKGNGYFVHAHIHTKNLNCGWNYSINKSPRQIINDAYTTAYRNALLYNDKDEIQEIIDDFRL